MTSVTPALLLDPLLVLLAAIGLALLLVTRRRRGAAALRRRRLRLGLAWAAWATLVLFATPRFSFWALGKMEMPPTDVAAALGDTPEERCAMVVLTAGTMVPPPRTRAWRPELLAGASLPRAIGAARVYGERPVGRVIVTGRAAPWDAHDDTARAMADVMVAFGVPRERVIIEEFALNTRQNAQFSLDITRRLGAEKIVVVTSALHMPRAVHEFGRLGVAVIPAPVDHRHERQHGLASFLPSAASLQRTGQVIHEVLGHFKP